MISAGMMGGRIGTQARTVAQRMPQCALRPAPRASSSAARVRGAAVVVRSAKAAELLQRANERYTAKDLMAAMKLYEDVLAQDGVTTRQKQAALYGSTAVHASFGDIELAQITLREGIRNGLDFEQALADPDLPELVTSVQMLIQLRRFNTTAQGAIAARSSRQQQQRQQRGGGGGGGGSPLSQDLGSIIGSATSDTAEIDTSVGGVLKRVVLLLVVLVGLGVGLFFLGLETVLKVE